MDDIVCVLWKGTNKFVTLKINKVYRVTHRTWDNIISLTTAEKLVTAKRKFIGTEQRFKTSGVGGILCYVFSSRITKRGYVSELSIPCYDLKEVKEV